MPQFDNKIVEVIFSTNVTFLILWMKPLSCSLSNQDFSGFRLNILVQTFLNPDYLCHATGNNGNIRSLQKVENVNEDERRSERIVKMSSGRDMQNIKHTFL